MPPKRKSTRNPGGLDEEGRPVSPPPKVRKPTVAANAQAIETLSEKISGVDSQLANMTILLTQLASNSNQNVPILTPRPPQVHDDHNNTVLQVLQPVQPAQSAATTVALDPIVQPSRLTNPALQLQAGPAYTGTTAPALAYPGAAQQPAQAGLMHTGTTASVQGYSAATPHPPARLRHHTAGPDYARLTGPPAVQTAGAQPTATAAWSTSAHLPAGPAPLPPPVYADHYGHHPQPQSQLNPWDHPTTIQDLEADTTLTRRVAEALHAVATPFAAAQGKSTQFPHFHVTRGPKKQKTNIGELEMPEYFWAFVQIIRSIDQSNQDLPFMINHLERIAEDAMSYDWSCVRGWSEEIFSRISKGKLRWSDSYTIDRLQTELSHKRPISSGQKASTTSAKRAETYDMTEDVRAAKPGPPCKFFQTGVCTHSTDHVQNGYRQIHVCTYCLSNKCQFQPHTLKDCKTKKFDKQKKSNTDSGFGN